MTDAVITAGLTVSGIVAGAFFAWLLKREDAKSADKRTTNSAMRKLLEQQLLDNQQLRVENTALRTEIDGLRAEFASQILDMERKIVASDGEIALLRLRLTSAGIAL